MAPKETKYTKLHELCMFNTLNTSTTNQNYINIDQCIDHSQSSEMFPIADLIQGHSVSKRQRIKELKPVTFVQLKPRQNKSKFVMVKALIDSGGTKV